MKLKPYPKYKDSGIQWIGKIPEGWDVERYKIRFKYIKGRIPKNLEEANGEGYLPYLSMGYLRGNEEGILYANDPNSIKVSERDLLLLWDGSNAGEFVLGKNGYLSSTMVKLNIKNLNSNFSFYLCKSFEALLRDLTIGMGIPHVNGDTLENIRIPVPNPHDQTAIANFLDKKTAKIDALIEKDKKLIELLKEKRTALINHVVTKGLDPNVKLKDSGIQWIGKIPEGWEVRKVSRSFDFIGSGTTPKTQEDIYYDKGDIPWVITGDLNDGLLKETSKRISKEAVRDYSTLKIYPKNSLIIAMYGATIGKTALLDIEACTNQACCVLAKSKIFETKYVFYWFIANKNNIISYSYGGGQPNISQDVIKTLKIPFPPKQEQHQIVEYLDKATSKIDKTIQKIEKKIKLLEEYKKSLIYYVVTGKVDVRGVVV